MAADRSVASARAPRSYEHLRHQGDGETVLYLVRHGQTAANQRQLLQGSSDHPLDELGLSQSRLIAEHFTTLPAVDTIISSPLQRALVTARMIGEQIGLTPLVQPALTELDFGDWESREFTEFQAEHPDLAARFLDVNDYEVGWPGGETRQEFYDRIWAAFHAILDEYGRHRVVVVAHGGVFGAFLAMVEGTSPNDMARYDILNCSLTELHVTNAHTEIKLRNDVCHLESLVRPPNEPEQTP